MSEIPQRPRLALRVGITGARDIPPERVADVHRQLIEVLTLIRQEMTHLATMNSVRGTYQNTGDPPELRFLSPLAEGADRLSAEAALDLGYSLYVPMPFRQGEYVKDFAHAGAGCGRALPSPSTTEFERLLQRATSVLELDGARDDPERDQHDEARSYEAVGRLVVRNCDLLIAVWDGKPGKGRGGTADTVRFSANFGPPVWWVHAEREQPPTWVDDVLDLDTPPSAGAAEQALHGYLSSLVIPPAPPRGHGFEAIIQRLKRVHLSPFEQWLAETKSPGSWRWTAYNLLLKWVANLDPPWTPPQPPADPVALHWYRHYRPADDCAGEYAARYRSSYVLIFLFAAVSLAFAALSAAVHEMWVVKFLFTAAELAALALITELVFDNFWGDWHARWIDYRLLAELCRKQQSLAPLGWSLPVWAVRELAVRAEEHEGGGEDRSAWVAWYFAALLRTAPMPVGTFDPARTSAARAATLDEPIQRQLLYHLGRQEQCQKASEAFKSWGLLLFLVLLLLVVAKLVLLVIGGITFAVVALGVVAIVVPALAAASVGIRAYAELELLAGESVHMAQAMRAAKRTIESLNPERPLASQQLGAVVYGVATLMLQEVQGWARLFRVKNVEIGA